MAKKIRIEINRDGVGELLQDPGVAADLRRRMEPVEAAAKAGAPVATGTYRDGIHIEENVTDRAAVHVVAESPNAQLVESRTGNLARAMDAVGGG